MECPEVDAEGNPSVTPAHTLWRSRAPTAAQAQGLSSAPSSRSLQSAQHLMLSPKASCEILSRGRWWHQRVHHHFVASRGFIAFTSVRPNESLTPSSDEWTNAGSNSGGETWFLQSSVVLGLGRRAFYNSLTCRCKGIHFCLCIAWADHAFTCCTYFYTHFGVPCEMCFNICHWVIKNHLGTLSKDH